MILVVLFFAVNSFSFYIVKQIVHQDASVLASLLQAVILFWTGVALVAYTWVTWNLQQESKKQVFLMSKQIEIQTRPFIIFKNIEKIL